MKGRLCFSMNGFSLHAATSVNTYQRSKLENLVEYIARGPLSNERLEILANGKVNLQLKTPWSDGTTHLQFTPTEFIEKLAALVPPPRGHLVRWCGVFAPNSKHRKRIVLKPEIKKGMSFSDDEEDSKNKPVKNYSWAKMLAKVFKVDVSLCHHCGGEMQRVCAVLDPDSVKRYLKHVGIEHGVPVRGPPRTVQEEFQYDDSGDQ